jgi:hypothetical protein
MNRIATRLASGALSLVAGIVVTVESADQAFAFRGGHGFGGGGMRAMGGGGMKSLGGGGHAMMMRSSAGARHLSVRHAPVTRHVNISRGSAVRHVNVRTPNNLRHSNIGITNKANVHAPMGPGGIKPGPSVLRHGPGVMPTGSVVIRTGPGLIPSGPAITPGPGYIPAGVPQAIIPAPRGPRVYREDMDNPPKDPPKQAKQNTPPDDEDPPPPPRSKRQAPLPCPTARVALTGYTTEFDTAKRTVAEIDGELRTTNSARNDRLQAASSDEEKARINNSYAGDFMDLARRRREAVSEVQVLESIVTTLNSRVAEAECK